MQSVKNPRGNHAFPRDLEQTRSCCLLGESQSPQVLQPRRVEGPLAPLPLRAAGCCPSAAGAVSAARPFCVLGELLQARRMQAEDDLPTQPPSPLLSQCELADQDLRTLHRAATVIAHMLFAPNQSHSRLPRFSVVWSIPHCLHMMVFLVSSSEADDPVAGSSPWRCPCVPDGHCATPLRDVSALRLRGRGEREPSLPAA